MEIKLGKMVVSDSMDKLIKAGDGVKCSCGGALKMVAHWDGTKGYGTTYNCDCGNIISTVSKRTKEDEMWW